MAPAAAETVGCVVSAGTAALALARELGCVAVLFVLGALGLAGLPPFGTALGKSVTAEAVGGRSPCSTWRRAR